MIERIILRGVLAFAFFMCVGTASWAQSTDPLAHWIANVGWDGVTPWEQYMRRNPAYLGPNALPIPRMLYPRVGRDYAFETSVELHRAPGDRTTNLYHRIRLPIAPERAFLQLEYRSREWYSTDTAVRDLRRARDASGSGSSEGDVWITSGFQLLRQKSQGWRPDLLLSVNVKTTAGKNLENARFTNSPGYIFDLHAGYSWYREQRWLDRIRAHGWAGLYVWQYGFASQNDAVNWGLQTEFAHRSWQLNTAMAGYWGWMNDGDRPYALRLELSRRWQRWEFMAGYQHHFQHITTHLSRVGICYRWAPPQMPVVEN